VGSIQVSAGQPQWLGPETGSNGGFRSCWSQAHHGCSPDPLHVWLPITAILLLPLLPLHGGLPHHCYRETGRERGNKVMRWIQRGWWGRSREKHRKRAQEWALRSQDRGECSSRWCTAEGQPPLAAAVTVPLLSLSTAAAGATGAANLILSTHTNWQRESKDTKEEER